MLKDIAWSMANAKSVNLDVSFALKEEPAGVVHLVMHIAIKGSVLNVFKIVADVISDLL